MSVRTILVGAVILLGALIFCPVVNAAQDPLWAYTRPDAKVMIGVNWQQAKASPVGRMISQKMQGPKSKTTSQGMEILEMVDRVMITLGPTPEGGNPNDVPALIAIEGRVDRTKLRAMLTDGTVMERYRGIDLLVPPKGKGDMVLGILNDRYLLLGERASIDAALDSAGGVQDAELLTRATNLSSRNDIWLAASGPLSKSGATGPTAGMPQMDDIEGGELGISLQTGLDMQVNLQMKDVEKAQGMAMMLKMVGGMAAAQMQQQGGKASPVLTQIAHQMNVMTRGNRVEMTLNLPMSVLEQGVLEARQGFEAAGKKTLESFLGMKDPVAPRKGVAIAAAAPPQPPPPPAEPPKPVKRTIRIVGAEGGDKEVNYMSSGGAKN
jgi:hypothetical protein